MVRSIEDDEDDQPNGNDAQAEDEKPLEKARKQSQNTCPVLCRMRSWMSSPLPALFVAGIPTAEHTQMVDGPVSSLRTIFLLESYTESLAEKSTLLALPLSRAASFGEGCGFGGFDGGDDRTGGRSDAAVRERRLSAPCTNPLRGRAACF
jgi:hypothetical protein